MNNKSHSKFITEYFEIILQTLFDNIGEKNLSSIIVTGSIARNQEPVWAKWYFGWIISRWDCHPHHIFQLGFIVGASIRW